MEKFKGGCNVSFSTSSRKDIINRTAYPYWMQMLRNVRGLCAGNGWGEKYRYRRIERCVRPKIMENCDWSPLAFFLYKPIIFLCTTCNYFLLFYL